MEGADLYDEFGNYIGPELTNDSLGALLFPEPHGPLITPLDGQGGPNAHGGLAGDAFQEKVDGEEAHRIAADQPMTDVDGVHANDARPEQQVAVRREARQHAYPEARDVYGDEAEILVEEEDRQSLSVPIVAPREKPQTALRERGLPPTRFSRTFYADLAKVPALIRNVAVVGALHHGKTGLLDMLVHATHDVRWVPGEGTRYTDVHLLARQRQISIKAMPVSVVLEDMRSKSYVLNVIDTPGHTDFADEMVAGVRLADGAVLVVDVVEGVTLPTKRIITHLVSEGVPFIVVMNKLDRLITELRIPPADAYFKIRHSIEEVNQVLRELGSSERKSPERGNVLFASTAFGWCFSLASFARIYRERMVVRVQPRHGAKAAPTFDPARFAQCLWGNVYYDAANHHFTKQPVRAATAHAGAAKLPRSFLAFILEPLYKIVAQTLGENPRDLQTTLAQLNIRLRGDELKQDAAPLMRLIFHRFFGGPTLFTKRVSQTVSERQAIACGVDGLVSAVVAHLPSPCDPSAVAPRWTDHLYTGPAMAAAAASSDDAAMPADPFRQAIAACSHADDAPVLIHVAKSVNFASTREFEVLGRVLSGTVRPGMRLSVMGESYVPDEDEEEVQTVTVGDLAIFNTRYSLPVAEVTAGNWLLMRGVDGNITKTATLCSHPTLGACPMAPFRPLRHVATNALRLAIATHEPGDLPKMLDGLRMISRSYLMLDTKVEESGEYIVEGVGELYLDCALHDLRKLYAGIEVKVADPSVPFSETVLESSRLPCSGQSANGQNRLTVIAEPMEPELVEAIERGRLENVHLATVLVRDFGWDALAARNVWCFGPTANGTNILINDTLPAETNRAHLRAARPHLEQGFRWATQEGPLLDGVLRHTKFRLLRADLAPELMYRPGGQIIPLARRVCYAAFLTATPRLLEPLLRVEVMAPPSALEVVYAVLSRRRGHATAERPKPGTPLTRVHALVPAIDMPGFETDLRAMTHGAAAVQMMFSHWQAVPGDPLDRDITIRPLEASTGPRLAKDFMLKTRRRKGLPETIGMAKFFDDAMMQQLVEHDIHLESS